MKFITIALVVQFLLSCWPKTNISLHLETNLFPDDNLCLDHRHRNRCITHYPGKTRIYIGVSRSKAKVTEKDCLQICFWMITSVRINEFFKLQLIITHHSRKNPSYFGVKRSKVRGQD